MKRQPNPQRSPFKLSRLFWLSIFTLTLPLATSVDRIGVDVQPPRASKTASVHAPALLRSADRRLVHDRLAPTSVGRARPLTTDQVNRGEPEVGQDAGRAIFREFDDWVDQYLAAPPTDRSSLVEKGQALAAQRRAALQAEIETNPEQSLKHAVPLAARALLPSSIADQLEERISGDADLTVLGTLEKAADGGWSGDVQRYVQVNGRTFRASMYGRRLQQVTQSSLPIHGIALGGVMAVHEDPVRVLEAGESPDPRLPVANSNGQCPISAAPANPLHAVEVGGRIVRLCSSAHAEALNRELRAREDVRVRAYAAGQSWTQGPKTVLFMRASFSDRPQEPISETNAVELMNKVDGFFQENSFGQTSLQATVTPLLTLPNATSFYQANPMSLLYDARQVALSAGYVSDNYDLDCVFFSSIIPVNQAYVGAKGAWLSAAQPGVVAHELGHNYGLCHANAWATTDGTTLGNGANQEYGDPFDTMGQRLTPLFAFGAYEKHLLNWLPDTAVTQFTTNGVYHLSGIDATNLVAGQSYAIRIPKDNQRDYWLEVRQAAGYPELEKSILVKWSPWNLSNGGAQLLNCNPQEYQHRPLHQGSAFYDLDIGLKVEPRQFFDTIPEQVDVNVQQVYYVPVELNSPDQVLASPTSPGWVSAQLKIPHADDYAVWMQISANSPVDPSLVSVQFEDGQVGRMSPLAFDDASIWNRVTGSNTKTVSSQNPASHLFSLAEGPHTIHIQVGQAWPEAVRLLITNDTATNLPPVLSEIAEQTVSPNSALEIPFSVISVGEDAADLIVEATSDDLTLIPASNLTVTGNSSSRLLSLATAPLRMGTAHVKVSVKDPPGRIYTETFTVNVSGPVQKRINQAAPGSIVLLPSGTTCENLTIDRDLTLGTANGEPATLDGSLLSPALTVQSNATVTLQGIQIQNGHGAGLRNYGTLRLVGATIRQNQGPGIVNRGSLIMEQVLVEANEAPSGGGAGLDNYSLATLVDCTFRNNRTKAGPGGAIVNRHQATLTCERCCLSGNVALHGDGGALNNLGSCTLVNCTLTGNAATDGGASQPGVNRSGGAIFNSGQVFLEASTICRNQADGNGGGLNSTGQIRISNCIVAENQSLRMSAHDASGTIVATGHNLLQNTALCTLTGNAGGVISGQDPRLGALGENGGFTETVALLTGSPAIDAADDTEAPKTDQRGVARPAGRACDLGAFEEQSSGVSSTAHGQSLVQLPARPNQTYLVQASSDLVHWFTLGEQTAGSSSFLQVQDADAAKYPQRFYRVAPMDPETE